jgi:hypothetical protein
MNDHDAMTAINTVLDQWFDLGLTAVEALHKIAQISGMNRIDHEAQQ